MFELLFRYINLMFSGWIISPLRPSDAYQCQQTKPSVPSHYPNQRWPIIKKFVEKNVSKICIKIQQTRKCIRKCGPFSRGLIVLNTIHFRRKQLRFLENIIAIIWILAFRFNFIMKWLTRNHCQIWHSGIGITIQWRIYTWLFIFESFALVINTVPSPQLTYNSSNMSWKIQTPYRYQPTVPPTTPDRIWLKFIKLFSRYLKSLFVSEVMNWYHKWTIQSSNSSTT